MLIVHLLKNLFGQKMNKYKEMIMIYKIIIYKISIRLTILYNYFNNKINLKLQIK